MDFIPTHEDLTKALEQTKDELAALKSYIHRFAHDLRNPLAAAKLGAQMIARKASDPEYAKAQALRVAETLDRADLLIQNFIAPL